MLPTLLAALMLLPSLAEAALLKVEEVHGTVSVTRNESETMLNEGDSLQEGDAVHVAGDAHLRVAVSRYGFFDLGSESELILERVPPFSYAEDLYTSLRLDRGFLRMVWQYPATADTWPLFVYFGNQRAALRAGEYFVEASAEGQQPFCVADGEAVVGLVNSTRPRPLGGPACYNLRTGQPAERQKKKDDDWIPMREGLSFAGLFHQDAPPPVAAPAPAAQPAQPGKPAKPAKGAKVQETAAPAPVSPEHVTKGWAVNVASSPDLEKASQDAARLKAAGLVPVITYVEMKGRQWYRVQLTGMATREEALELAARVKTELGYADAWLQKI